MLIRQHMFKYYFSNIKDGILFTCYKNGYPIVSIDGNEMVINYLNKYYWK